MQNAYSIALKWLNNRALTSFEVKKKLRDKKFDDDTISKIIEKLKEYDFINDELYAANYVKYVQNLKKKGRFYIIKKLMEKGVNRNVIDNALSDYLQKNEFDTALEAVKKKFKNAMNEKTFLKVNSFLKSRGFPDEIIYEVIKSCRNGCKNF